MGGVIDMPVRNLRMQMGIVRSYRYWRTKIQDIFASRGFQERHVKIDLMTYDTAFVEGISPEAFVKRHVQSAINRRHHEKRKAA